MNVATTAAEVRQTVKAWRRAGSTVAFVPTMGNLHAGHLKLVSEAQKQADKTVVSIFVNPAQFGPGEDFERYPRTEAEDRRKLTDANTDLLFLPGIADLYAPDAKTAVTVAELSELHCGRFRPGHFSGVATVVCKLLNIVQPDLALFGLKDFQQFAVIRTMVRDLDFDTALIGVETVREADGLALSSRNGYLNASERRRAPLLYRTLAEARAAILAGDGDYGALEAAAAERLRQAGFEPEYFTISRSRDLRAAEPQDRELVILTAARLGQTRLIDNIVFERF